MAVTEHFVKYYDCITLYLVLHILLAIFVGSTEIVNSNVTEKIRKYRFVGLKIVQVCIVSLWTVCCVP